MLVKHASLPSLSLQTTKTISLVAAIVLGACSHVSLQLLLYPLESQHTVGCLYEQHPAVCINHGCAVPFSCN